jgi:hypothetical protein
MLGWWPRDVLLTDFHRLIQPPLSTYTSHAATPLSEVQPLPFGIDPQAGYLPTPRHSPLPYSNHTSSCQYVPMSHPPSGHTTPHPSQLLEPQNIHSLDEDQDMASPTQVVSQAPIFIPCDSKRRVVVMGKRGDCDKCKFNLPGHFLHYIYV